MAELTSNNLPAGGSWTTGGYNGPDGKFYKESPYGVGTSSYEMRYSLADSGSGASPTQPAGVIVGPLGVSAYNVDPMTGLPYGGIPQNFNTGLVGGAGAIEGEVNNFNTGIYNLKNDPKYAGLLDSLMNPVTDPNVAADISRIRALGANTGVTTAEDEARIRAAGTAAGQRFDPMISRANEEKRKGMPKATIAAGERGGFMNTQFAGGAALQPTEGGDFVGAGGELESIKSAYDLNIADLQSQKNLAISQAEQAMREYIRTGKQSDFENAQKAYEFADTASKRQSEEAERKVNAIIKWNQLSNEMNKPLINATEAVQNYALESMQKYRSGFDDLSTADLIKMTPAQIQERILSSDEYKEEVNDILSISEAKSLGVPYGTKRKDAMGRGIIPGDDGDGSGSGNFTKTQINSGAAIADMDISEFRKLGADDKNFFINKAKSAKALIDDAIELNGLSNQELKDMVDEKYDSDAISNYLYNYIDLTAPAEEEEVDEYWGAVGGLKGGSWNPLNWF